jgi:hypothetical protein
MRLNPLGDFLARNRALPIGGRSMSSDEGRVPMTTDRSNAMTLGALGMLSGAVAWMLGYVIDLVHLFESVLPLLLSWTLGRFIDPTHLPRPLENVLFALGPGSVFGVIIGSLLRRRGRAAGWRLVGYVVAAALASFGAIYAGVTYHIELFGLHAFGGPGAAELAITGFVGGLVWGVLLGLASIPLLRVPAWVVLGAPVVIGSAFGLALPIILLDPGRGLWSWTSFALCTLWPGAYAASLAPMLRSAPISHESLSR